MAILATLADVLINNVRVNGYCYQKWYKNMGIRGGKVSKMLLWEEEPQEQKAEGSRVS